MTITEPATNGQVDTLVIDPEDLTLGEIEELEEIIGAPFMELMEKGFPAKAMTALVFIIMRRADESFTLDEARKIKLSKLDLKDPDPTAAAS